MKKFFVPLFLFVTFFSITLFAAAEENADTQACNYARRSMMSKFGKPISENFQKELVLLLPRPNWKSMALQFLMDKL